MNEHTVIELQKQGAAGSRQDKGKEKRTGRLSAQKKLKRK